MGNLSAKNPAMAFCSGERDHDSLYFTSKTPHFFKVLLGDAIQHGKLKIPPKFVRDYGSGISSPVFLKVPSGAIWQVELTKSNAEIWLQSGWREFVEHHSLELQDFVVFRYEGNCLFNVVIFDKSATEIEYPINSCQAAGIHNFNGQSQEAATEEHDDTSVEILAVMPPGKNRKEKPPLPCSRPSRKMRIHSKEGKNQAAEIHNFNGQSLGSATEEDDDTSIEILDVMPPCKKRREKPPLPCSRPSRKMRIHSNANRTESDSKLRTLASKFISESIKVSDNKFKVPKRNGSSPWHAQGFSARGSNAARKSNSGMNASQKHNRRMQNTITGKEKAKALQRASSFKSQNTFFLAVMQPSFVTGRYILPIPLIFSKKYLMKKHGKILCVVDGKSWRIELVKNNRANKQHFTLCNGWKECSLDNNLDVGDVCVFELVKSTEITFKVVVFHSDVEDSFKSLDDGNGSNQVTSTKSLVTSYAIKSEGATSSCHKKPAAQKPQLPQGNFNQLRRQGTAGSQDSQVASSLRTLGVFAASSNFAPENPNCKVLVRSCHLNHRCLHLPAAFTRRYMMPRTGMVTLQVAERSWLVKLKYYPNRSSLTSGWNVFAKENSLRADDICVFELTDTSDAVLRVSILKHAG